MEHSNSGIIILILCAAIFFALMIYVVLAKKKKTGAKKASVKSEIVSDAVDRALSDIELTKKDE